MTTTQDPVGLALASIGVGATTGGCIMSAGALALRLVQNAYGQGNAPVVEFFVLSGSVVAGVIASILITLIASRAIDDLWHRGVAAAIATIVGILLGALTAPIDMLAGPPGLSAYGVALFALALLVWRRSAAIRHP
jgi:hypothetical protein